MLPKLSTTEMSSQLPQNYSLKNKKVLVVLKGVGSMSFAHNHLADRHLVDACKGRPDNQLTVD